MRTRALRPVVLAGMAALIASCGIAVRTSSNGVGGSTPSGSSTPAGTSAAPTPTPVTAGGPTAGPGGCPVAAAGFTPIGVTLISCYTMTGEVSASGGFYDIDEGAGAVSCADWAKNGEAAGGAAGELLPGPDPSSSDISVDGNDLTFGFSIGPYTGPGSYPSTDLDEFASYGDNTDWSNNVPTDFSATVSADGSGTLKATLSDDSGNGQVETITESWICVFAPGL